MLKQSPVVHGKLAKRYAQKYYEIEDDIIPIFELIDTPFLNARIKPGMRVMDAMMGRGRHAIRYAKRGVDVWGNDLNPHMVAIARKAAERACAKLRFSALDVCTLKGVPSNRFDVTFAMFSAVGTIPGSKNRSAAVAAMARVTKPGGLVIVHGHNRLDTWTKPSWIGWAVQTTFAPQNGLETGDMITDYNGLEDMFNHFYTPAEFRRDFRAAGLDVIEEQYMQHDPPGVIGGLLRKFRSDGFIFVGRKPDMNIVVTRKLPVTRAMFRNKRRRTARPKNL